MRVHDTPGLRVVARPDALDTAVWCVAEGSSDRGRPSVLRFAPDEAFGMVGLGGSVEIDDPFAIVVEEAGFISISFEVEEFEHFVAPHVEWPIPEQRPTFAQGAIAGVPAKIDVHGGQATVLVARAYADELLTRLGISARLPGSPFAP